MKITGNGTSMTVEFSETHGELPGVLFDSVGLRVTINDNGSIGIRAKQGGNLVLTDDGLFVLMYPSGYKHMCELTPNMKQLFRNTIAVGYEVMNKTRRGYLLSFKESNE
jgi:hypothetical protein